MSWLLDRYTSFLSKTPRKQGMGYNGPCPVCGGDVATSDRFMIWPDTTEAIGKVCLENNLSGRFNCRRCGITGDTVAYLELCESMTFAQAMDELGIKKAKNTRKKYKAAPSFEDKVQNFIPKAKDLPADIWLERVTKLSTEAQSAIWKYENALKWLASRGIFEEDIKKYKLGYIEPEGAAKEGRFRDRKAFGLEAKYKSDGSSKKLFIPRGISIPTFRFEKTVALRIRRHQEDLKKSSTGYAPPKYMEFEGSISAPMVLLPQVENSFLACWVVVEAQLDAILIHSATKGMVGAVAINSNRNKPDAYTHSLLKDSPRILLALDYEDSGAGVAGLDFWTETYPQSKRWCVPEGKDPGEAFKLGVDIKLWVEAGLPSSALYTTLSHSVESKNANGHVDTFLPVVEHLGGAGQNLNISARFDRGRESLKEGYENRCNTVAEISLFEDVERALKEAVDADKIETMKPSTPEEKFIQNVWFLMDTFPQDTDLKMYDMLKDILVYYKENYSNAD